jgi:hypothetical protein
MPSRPCSAATAAGQPATPSATTPSSHPADVKRFAELGVIANCTPLWGTDYDGTFYDTYLAKLALSEWRNASTPTATSSAPGHW